MSHFEQPQSVGTDAPVELPTAAIIKDVDQLKANLKEEKRARAEAEVEVTEPQQPSGQADVTQQDSTDPSAPESERRKRRRVDSEAEVVTEILDGPLPIPVTTESKPAEETQSGVIDVVKLAQELLDGEHSSGKDVDVVSSDADKVEATAPVASVETATQPAKVSEADKGQDEPVSNEENPEVVPAVETIVKSGLDTVAPVVAPVPAA